MAGVAKFFSALSEQDRQILAEWANSRSAEWRLVERAKIINMLLAGEQVNTVATALGTSQNTVIEWRSRFSTNGIKGWYDLPRSGKPPKYDKEFRNQVLKTLEPEPPKGQASWDGPSLSKHLGGHQTMPPDVFFERKAFALRGKEAGV